jgi:hypothetical protein
MPKKKKTKKTETVIADDIQLEEQEKTLDKKEEEGFDDGILKLSDTQRLELMVSHLKRENIKQTIKAEHNRTEFLEREGIICKLRISDLKAQLKRLDRDHQDFIEDVGRKLGVILKNAVINPETGEIQL